MRFYYTVDGMHCSLCIEKIKLALSSHVQVIELTLDPPLLQLEADKPLSIDQLNGYLSSVGNYRLHLVSNYSDQQSAVQEIKKNGFRDYYPIFLITLYIIGITAINNIHWNVVNWDGWMTLFMAGFFLVFSAFKFLDIKGFADSYSTYDLLAKRWYTYGFIYPFLELALGVSYIGGWFPIATLYFTIFIMGFSSFGVINSLLKKKKLQCACLGTILKVPLSSVTLIEDLSMVGLAVLSLLIMK